MTIPMKGNWNYPTRVWAGPGRIAELPAACAELGMRKPLVVTDSGLRDSQMIKQGAWRRCRVRGCLPTCAAIRWRPMSKRGSRRIAPATHDGVVAFGGGSGLDAGKVIAFMSGQTRPLWDFEDVGDWWTRADPAGIAPIVAVPTTAGTGSAKWAAPASSSTSRRTRRRSFSTRR